ncbi:MAG: hypothetical protein HY613_01985 [Candidatus Rokubacteria bacterium]|nr:hypothetical protein [Candidatus Rokubacteria bacterium]
MKQQRLITAKHRKIRKLKTLHPNVRIRLLNRKDWRALARKFGWRETAADTAGA